MREKCGRVEKIGKIHQYGIMKQTNALYKHMSKLFKITSFVAVLAIFGATSVYAHCGSCASDSVQKPVAKMNFPDVDHDTLKQAIADGKVVLIDVNGSQSYASGHIPGAVDFASLGAKKIASALPRDKTAFIVAYCGGPSCGAYKQAAKAVAALGYTDVHHYSAGISGWKNAGEYLEKTES